MTIQDIDRGRKLHEEITSLRRAVRNLKEHDVLFMDIDFSFAIEKGDEKRLVTSARVPAIHLQDQIMIAIKARIIDAEKELREL